MNLVSSPEELAVQLEDALLLGDRPAVAELFGPAAVLITAAGGRPVRGPEQIAEEALRRWSGAFCYLAEPARVIQVQDLALLVSREEFGVARRYAAAGWKWEILHSGIG